MPTPLLEELYVYRATFSGHCCPAGSQVAILPRAPCLRFLSIEACLLKRIAGLRCDALARLHVHGHACKGVPFEPFVAILRLIAGSLEELDIRATCDTFPLVVPSPVTDLRLPHLRHLNFNDFCGMSMLVAYIGHIVLPALHTLQIDCYHGRADELALIAACNTLTMLRLRFTGPTQAGALVRVLRALPYLQYLTVERYTFSVEDFEQLSEPAGGAGEWVAPQMHGFCAVECAFTAECTPEHFLDFVRARTTAGAASGPCVRLEDVSIAGDRIPVWLVDKAFSILDGDLI
ncbi:hypothetical protein AURDEDRAFT_173994 [Auricularia subglabra TFB-10046 SS5]|uniref:F-box domain-containing protein n=1 Tax=Auricularia subglabra (strain TFB-10046 / SS5) TaxID=717982 RepID=J0DA09_AURST|nr:hypothetical protein AURDEDRAFT_173994 [Auricularia subglabra TFB-10046 SS5]